MKGEGAESFERRFAPFVMSVGLSESHEPASGPAAREQMTRELRSLGPRLRASAVRFRQVVVVAPRANVVSERAEDPPERREGVTWTFDRPFASEGANGVSDRAYQKVVGRASDIHTRNRPVHLLGWRGRTVVGYGHTGDATQRTTTPWCGAVSRFVFPSFETA